MSTEVRRRIQNQFTSDHQRMIGMGLLDEETLKRAIVMHPNNNFSMALQTLLARHHEAA